MLTESANHSGTPPTGDGIGANNDVYDNMSAATSTNGATILSSAQSSSRAQSPGGDGRDNDDGGAGCGRNIGASSLPLSLHPSMVDSSVLEQRTNNGTGNWIEFDAADLARSIVSSDVSQSFAVSEVDSLPDNAGVFANIGRSMVLASAASSYATSDTDTYSTATAVTDTGKGIFSRLQTDEDWENFRAKANDYLNAIIAEEMKAPEHGGKISHDSSVDKTSLPKKEESSLQRDNQGLIWRWFQEMYKSINAAITGIVSKEDSSKSKYFSFLIQEIIEIKGQLERLPPVPPSLPLGDLPLDHLPNESRDKLVRYHVSLDAWRGEMMPRREELTAQYVLCQEKLLAAIIDAEEEMFYDNDESSRLGTVDGDGYVHVVERESPAWDDAVETLVISQSKCQLTTLTAAFVAALTAGAGYLLTLQAKRR